MAENRKLIDTKQPFSFVFKPSNNQRTALLVKNLNVKITNFCKLIPHCENVTFWFCYFKTMVMTRYHKIIIINDPYSEILGLALEQTPSKGKRGPWTEVNSVATKNGYKQN